MRIDIAGHWFLQIDQSPDWLFVRLFTEHAAADPSPPFAEHVWKLSEGLGILHLVIELDGGVMLTSYLVGQLVMLHKRVTQGGGAVRICGFGEHAYDVLKVMRLHTRFPNYPTRGDAVMGHLP